MKRETAEMIMEAKSDWYIPPILAVDNILPVYHSVRPASTFSLKSVGLPTPGLDYDEAYQKMGESAFYRRLKEGMKKWGVEIGCTIEPVFGHLFGVVYVGADEKALKGLTEQSRKAHEEISKGQFSQGSLDAILMNAELLGYPDCCAKRCAEERREIMEGLIANGSLGKSKIPLIDIQKTEIRAQKELSDLAGTYSESPDGNYTKIVKLPLEVLESYFTGGMYPCKPGCERAGAIGDRIITKFREADPDLADMYVIDLIASALWTWEQGPERLQKANYSIYGEVKKTIERLISEIGRARRNDPCPCESGKKFKKCCGSPETMSEFKLQFSRF